MRIFVIWDQTIPNLAGDIDALLKACAKEQFELVALGLVEGDQGYVLKRIEQELATCQGAIAVLDKHNANVGFEMGLALGMGLPLALLASGAVGTGWSSKPPVNGLIASEASFSRSVLLATLRRLRDQGASAWNVVARPPDPLSDGAPLLLWPADKRGEIYLDAADEVQAARLPSSGWTLADLPTKLAGVRKVVWVVPQPEPDVRDGEENARLAVVAGYARAVKREAAVLVQEPDAVGRSLTDLRGHGRTWKRIGQLQALLAEELGPAVAIGPPEDPLVTYRKRLRDVHAHLIPFDGMTETVMQQVVLELNLDPCGDGRRERGPDRDDDWAELGSTPTLRELLLRWSAPGRRGGPGRLIVRAEPGAGKTTSARHLVHSSADDPDHLPVLLPLVELAGKLDKPFELVEKQLDIPGLAASLTAEAQVPGRVWLLLDGLDEVGDRLHETLEDLRKKATAPEWRHVAIVVLGRDVAFQHDPLREPWRQARLRPLDRLQQAELIGRLVPDDERRAELQTYIARWPTLQQMAQNPLLLTLFSVVGRQALEGRTAVPYTRHAVYGAAIDLLLKGDHREHKRPVKSVSVARRVLGVLALELHEAGGESWSLPQVLEAIWRAYDADEVGAKRVDGVYEGRSPERLLGDLDHNGGLFGRLDGIGEVYRFQHRSLREFLVAEALRLLPERRETFEERWIKAVAKLWGSDATVRERAATEAARSGEVLGLLASMEKAPIARWKDLRERNADAMVRLLKTTEGLAPRDVLELMFDLPLRGDFGPWDGDDLVPALLAADDSGGAAEAALWELVKPEQSKTMLGVLWDALARVAARGDSRKALDYPPDRVRFFGLAGIALQDEKWVEHVPLGAPAALDRICVVDLPGGTFVMGSPEDVGDEDEHPAHAVTVSAFAIGQTAVTTEQYARFDPKRGSEGHPATGVSWYEATLFAGWLGGRLPTEAEWEYACRAGSTSDWCFGDDETRLNDFAWCGPNTVQSVGTLAPNPWGLYDMHGNVWEWCADGLRMFDGSKQTDPVGPAERHRVIRGGSFEYSPGTSRSAFRHGSDPTDGWHLLGLRLVFPIPLAKPEPLSA